MFRTLNTLIRASVAEAEEDLSDRNACTLLAQHLRDARAELARHRAGLAALIARETKETRVETGLIEQMKRREEEAGTALAAGDDALAADIADDMLRIEEEIERSRTERRRVSAEVAKARTGLDAAERTFNQLSDQLRMARARAPSPHAPQCSSLKQAEHAAARLQTRMERQDDLAAAYEQMKTSAEAQDLNAKLKASGLFDDRAERRDAILNRIKTKGETK